MGQTYLEITKRTNTLLIGLAATFLISFLFFSFLSPIQTASATVFNSATYTRNDGAVITVTDLTKMNGIPDETMTVTVTSDTNPTGVQVTLTEGGDSGVFTNTALFFSDGLQQLSPGDKVTVTINDPSLIGATGVEVHSLLPDLSEEDGTAITPFVVTETSPGSGIFQAHLQTTTDPTSGNTIHVSPGGVLVVINTLASLNSYTLVSPPVAGTDVLRANIGDTISVFSNGVLLGTATIIDGGGEGGGGGGLIRPGLVLDVLLRAIGGSPFIVSPPSFGGDDYQYSDGLTLTQGTHKTIFDTSKYNQEIPTQVMASGQKVDMTFKTFESYNPTGVIHMGLYIIPRGQDMITPNSIGSIVYDKNSPVEVSDPNHILSSASASTNSDGKFQYFQFSFVPTKSYDTMSFLVRTWNDYMYSTDIRVHDAVDQPAATKTLPAGVIKYDTFDDLQAALEKDGFYKPQMMAHIHSTADVFGTTQGGHVYWLYDTVQHSVTLVIADKNDNELYSIKASLDPFVPDKKGDYGFMQFTVPQLNRSDQKQEENAMGIEAAKAMFMALENGLMPHRNW